MEKRWFIKEQADQKQVNDLCSSLSINPALAEILVQRGIDTYAEAEQFFNPKLSELHDPFLMKNMGQAVERIQHAITKQERVLLYGDYDVDGTTAVAVMWNVLHGQLKELAFYIPDRYKEGYGISRAGIDFANDNEFSLIIALDCGIKAHEQAELAQSYGIDLLICDHHEPSETLPQAIILNPKQKNCDYPYKELSGCGVGFKLLQALLIEQKADAAILLSQLDFLAISIAADIVPITGENRILCHFGLELINKRTRPCWEELLRCAQKKTPLTLTNVVFILAPRINAAGRLDSGNKAVQLMIEEDRNTLRSIAESIEQDNIERRNLDQTTTEEALELISNDPLFALKQSTVVYQEHWHKGVIGIVASRLIEQHYRPTIVLTKASQEGGGKITGSARGIVGLNLYDALEACAEHLEQFGGHEFAAGMTLQESDLAAFSDRFELEVQKRMDKRDLVPQQTIDRELNFSSLFETGENVYSVPKFQRILKRLEPHGPKNMKPVFLSKNVFVEQVFLLKDAHLKLKLTQADVAFDVQAIAFNMADKLELCLSKEPIDLIYTLEINSWNEQENIQLQVKDIRSSL